MTLARFLGYVPTKNHHHRVFCVATMAVKIRLKGEFSQLLQVLRLVKCIKRDYKWSVMQS